MQPLMNNNFFPFILIQEYHGVVIILINPFREEIMFIINYSIIIIIITVH